jgi:NAD-dependent deacetylase
MPKLMDEIYSALDRADVFVAIGTSGRVYPAAGFVEVASASGAHTIEINLEASDVAPAFAEHRIGPASEQVVEWVNELLAD